MKLYFRKRAQRFLVSIKNTRTLFRVSVISDLFAVVAAIEAETGA